MKHHRAKLTSDQVAEIRTRYGRGDVTYQRLAREYGVSAPTIGQIINGSTWKDAPANPVSNVIGERVCEGRLKIPKGFRQPSDAHTINVAKRVYLANPYQIHCGIEFVLVNKWLLLDLIRIAETITTNTQNVR
jgi:hypothetical protein